MIEFFVTSAILLLAFIIIKLFGWLGNKLEFEEEIKPFRRNELCYEAEKLNLINLENLKSDFIKNENGDKTVCFVRDFNGNGCTQNIEYYYNNNNIYVCNEFLTIQHLLNYLFKNEKIKIKHFKAHSINFAVIEYEGTL